MEKDSVSQPTLSNNPLRQISIAQAPQYPQSVSDKYQSECDYCLGWARVVTPSSMLGWTSFNAMTRYDDDHFNHDFILGTDSPKRIVLHHCGVFPGKLGWYDLVSTYLPSLNPHGDPTISKEATIVDFLRHSTGIGSPQIMVMGPHGSLIASDDNVIDLLNHTPTGTTAYGQRFQQTFHYNNLIYGLVAIILQQIYGKPYHTILREKILGPLQMSRTSARSRDFVDERNIADAIAWLENGEQIKLPVHNWLSGEYVPLSAAVGMQSTVDDMLKYAVAVLERANMEKDSVSQPTLSNNPLRQISIAQAPQYPQSVSDKYQSECDYCLGWARVVTPSSMLGWTSFNAMTRYDDDHFNHDFILGTDSPKRIVLHHCGVFPGGSSAFYTFPETSSAIIVFSNGMQEGDASDFAAQIMMQALFDMKPEINFTPLVLEEQRRRRAFYPNMASEWAANRKVDTEERPIQEYVGEYEGLATSIQIFVQEETGKLAVKFNGHEESSRRLDYYNHDAYSFLPVNEDEMWKSNMIDWEHYKMGIFEFQRMEDGAGGVTGLLWQWDPWEDPALFVRGMI